MKKALTYFLIFLFLMTGTFSFATESAETTETEEVITQQANDVNIYSEAAVLIDSNTGKILYNKNANTKMYPASTTKIMTALLTLEKGNIEDTTTASKTAISGIPSGYSSAYLSDGEQMTVEQLLEVLLIHSANDAANVLAEYISGSIDEFVNLMNERATELGCTNTNFVNTNGIHNENHYSTAYDLSLIMQECMKNETFRKIVSMQSCTIPKTNKSDERTYKNTNSLIDSNSSYYLANCIGGKTGYTTEAQNCLISVCNKDGLELISVVLKAKRTGSNQSTRYSDSKELFNYGYSNYSIKKIASPNDVIYSTEIKNGTKDTKSLDLILASDISFLVNNNDYENIDYTITLNDNLIAPIAANSVVGTITYKYNDSEYTENLLASHNVEKNNFMFFIIIGIFIILIILLILILIIMNRKNHKKFKNNLGRHRYLNQCLLFL